MGAHLDIGRIRIHTKPNWDLVSASIDQDSNTVSVNVETSNNIGGRFEYHGMWVQLVRVYKDGHTDCTEIAGVHGSGSGNNIYRDFSGTKNVDMQDDNVTRVYLAMRCTMHADGGGDCDISGAANQNPGYEIPGTSMTLIHTVVPEIGNVRNTNPYNGNQKVSASTNSVSIAFDWTGGDKPTNLYYSHGDYWRPIPGNAYSFTLDGYAPGYSVFVNILATNSAGNSPTQPGITIRTRYDAPTVSANSSNVGLEGFRISWSSNRTMKSIRYKIDGVRDWTSFNVGSNSGNMTVTGLNPGTQYTVRVSGYSSDAYDGILSNEVTFNVTTLAIATITGISNITHGQSFTVSISNPSGSNCTLRLWVDGNGGTASISKSTTGNITVTPSEAEWDNIYRRYTNSNSVTLKAQLTTHGSKNYTDSQKTKTITLTGIQKTAHFGVNNAPRRVQLWVGDSSGKARRCVGWVGTGSGTKRTI